MSGCRRDRRGYSFIAIVVVGVVAVACSDNRPGIWLGTADTLVNGAVLISNPAEGMWHENAAWQLVEELRIGTRAGEGPAAFGEIRDFDVDWLGRIYVLDWQAQKVHLFGGDGRHVRTIGRPGKGPGEFAGAMGMAIDPSGRLWVANQGNARYSVFDSSGVLVKELPRFMAVAVTEWLGVFDLSGALYDVVFYPSLAKSFTFAYARYDSTTGEFVDTMPSVGFPSRAPLFLGRQLATSHGWWLGVATDYRLYLTNFIGDTLRVVERPYEPIPLAKSQHDSATAQARAMRRAMRDELRRHPQLPPAPDYEPIFSGFVEDDEGYLWVILTPPLDAEGSLLDVFDPAGRYLGSVTAPYNLEHKPRPVIRGSKLYAITKDELDVPYVVALHIDGRE